MSMIRPVFSLVIAVWFLQLAGGMLSVVTPLGLAELGVGSDAVGVIAALHAAGFMAGAYYAPKLIGELGNIRIFAAAAALTAIGALSQGLWLSELSWAVIRFVQGVTFAAMFAAAEAWLGRVTPIAHRGNVLGVYNVAAKAALLLGPLIILHLSPLDSRNFLWCGLFLAAALVPVCLTRRQEPVRFVSPPLPILRLLKTSPSASVGVFIAGLVNSGTLALLPIYASAFAPQSNSLALAGLAFSVANIGGLLSQWPAGLLSDRIDRRNVVAVMALISSLAAAALWMLGNEVSITLMLTFLFVWGAGSLSFYGVCIAHGIDRVEDEDITAMMSMLLMVWALGSVIGPLLAGGIMQTSTGAPGLFAFAATGLGALFIIMLFRRLEAPSVPEHDQSDWQPAMPAGIAGGPLDPRTE